jgi:murein DD-endopeptidase MepM/ murein hydrolase activator NlpD
MPNLPEFPFARWKVVVFGIFVILILGVRFEPASEVSASFEGSSLALNTAAITQGYKVGHSGVDVAGKKGSAVKSFTSGTVVKVANEDNYCPGKGFGKYVMVEDESGSYTFLYAHLNSFDVSEGDNVDEGEMIGTVGTTGKVTGPHLHLTVFKTNTLETKDHACGARLTGETINPLKVLNTQKS